MFREMRRPAWYTNFRLRSGGPMPGARWRSLRCSAPPEAALVRTACGGTFLVGWSPGFGGECPLRLVSAVFDTQAGYDEDSGAVVVLRSEDTSFSKPFVGTLPE